MLAFYKWLKVNDHDQDYTLLKSLLPYLTIFSSGKKVQFLK